MVWEGTDRRRFPRADYSCVVRVRQKGMVEVFQTKTENIGCGGVCVMLPKGLEMFSPVETEIDLRNGEEKISCDGRIVWVVRRAQIKKDIPDTFDTGIEFANLKEKDRLRIDEIVKECLKKDESSKLAN